MEIVKEPVSKWRNTNGSNLLKMVYEDGPRYNFAFQSRVQQTMLEGHLLKTDKKVKLMERSLHSTMEIFNKHQVRYGTIEKVEADVLRESYNFFTANKTFETDVDLFVYLRTDPQIAFERVGHRNRTEEATVSLEYIEQLHMLHEEWLGNNRQYNNTPVLILDANKNEEEMKLLVSRLDDVITGSRKLNSYNA